MAISFELVLLALAAYTVGLGLGALASSLWSLRK